MTDPTEDIRKQMLAEINAAPGSREYLEHKHGQVWTPAVVRGLRCAWASWPPRRREKEVRQPEGEPMFQASPRFYFGFEPYRP